MTQTTLPILKKRPALARGHADHGWLKSAHTFSFADYYDPKHMGFRSLRVINDDQVAGGKGFGRHPHRDMEIFSYVISGALEHKDSLGNGSVLRPGQIQLMSAGTGVFHSEFNPLSEVSSFLQIWIQPSQLGLKPSYTEWTPSPKQAQQPKLLIISPDGREGSATIHQEAEIYRVRLQAGEGVQHTVREGRGVWVQIAKGSLEVNGMILEKGDGASLEEPETLNFRANEEVEALIFDLA